VTVKVFDAPVRVDQVAKGWRGSPLMMQAHNEEENDILLGGPCTDGRKRAQHTIMIKESHKTVLQDSHQ